MQQMAERIPEQTSSLRVFRPVRADRPPPAYVRSLRVSVRLSRLGIPPSAANELLVRKLPERQRDRRT
eukprot:scaffold504131_cov33-Prasinocladus_malaysianus.AAC.1